MNQLFENACLLLGRTVLGLYFILPGIQKITAYEQMTAYMARHDVPIISILLPLTIFLQIVLGLCIVVGWKSKASAFLLAGLTLVISVFMHNFWHLPDGGDVARETQNFVKNMAIMAGLLVMSARGAGQLSLDQRFKTKAL